MLGLTTFIIACTRRFRNGAPKSDDDDSSDDEDDDVHVSIVDVKRKSDALLEIKTKMDEIKRLDGDSSKTNKNKAKKQSKKEQ